MKGRVLAVDDEKSIRAAISMACEEDGWECVTAGSAEEAIEVLRRESFDVLFFDKNMPGLSGVELAAKVRHENRDVPVVIMTAFASSGSARASLDLGVDRFIEKPFADVFELPRLAAELVAQGRRRWVPDPHVFDGEGRPTLPDPRTLMSLRVVVAARDAGFRDEVARRLQPLGVQIAIAETEDEAAGAAASEPDLVVVDAREWAESALPLLERVRARARDAAFVVFVDEDPPLAALKRMIELGVAGLVPRRFDEALSERLKEIVRAVRLR